jgi:hypothetical protein
MTSEDIKPAVKYLFHNHEYKLFNTFIFNWESDFFSMTKSNYTYEVEIKISRSDFRADFQKAEKHFLFKNHKNQSLLVQGSKHSEYYGRDSDNKPLYAPFQNFYYVNPCKKIPNKFYYAVPEGLIKIEEVPEYAGLIYVGTERSSARIVKECPYLHKEKHDLTKVLLNKFYYQSMEFERKIEYHTSDGDAKTITSLKNEVTGLKRQLSMYYKMDSEERQRKRGSIFPFNVSEI